MAVKKSYDFTGGVRGKYACKPVDAEDLRELRKARHAEGKKRSMPLATVKRALRLM